MALATFQVLNSHTWLVATTLETEDRMFPWWQKVLWGSNGLAYEHSSRWMRQVEDKIIRESGLRNWEDMAWKDCIVDFEITENWASLVPQWLRIRLPMQGTQVRALVQEDAICRSVTKPVHHNFWACALELVSQNYWARVPQLLKPSRLEPMLRSKRSHRNEKPLHRNEE